MGLPMFREPEPVYGSGIAETGPTQADTNTGDVRGEHTSGGDRQQHPEATRDDNEVSDATEDGAEARRLHETMMDLGFHTLGSIEDMISEYQRSLTTGRDSWPEVDEFVTRASKRLLELLRIHREFAPEHPSGDWEVTWMEAIRMVLSAQDPRGEDGQ
ncbi:hypothetical protein PV08_01544 [Exophiala spinifera]|uniref:Uncharacterized protein n=1 Tax=Exophiala spinifera TaxID=91928 RepID=A0A0D2BRB8_9EURO|nr:uncharacterized protein PV08_01544 [Exophiala spinifera]KIW20965.1 hypothetical protein PV08_01544 [Exophiala spinifera]